MPDWHPSRRRRPAQPTTSPTCCRSATDPTDPRQSIRIFARALALADEARVLFARCPAEDLGVGESVLPHLNAAGACLAWAVTEARYMKNLSVARLRLEAAWERAKRCGGGPSRGQVGFADHCVALVGSDRGRLAHRGRAGARSGVAQPVTYIGGAGIRGLAEASGTGTSVRNGPGLVEARRTLRRRGRGDDHGSRDSTDIESCRDDPGQRRRMAEQHRVSRTRGHRLP